MKNTSLFSLFLFVVSVIFISCAGNNSEKLREDSIRIADSIAAVEAAQEEAARAAEQARLDSIRQDSIEQEAKFNLAQMSFINNNNWLKTLPKFGFELKNKKTTEDWDEWEGTDRVVTTDYTYQRDLNGRVVIFEFSLREYKEDGTEIGNRYDATMIIKDPAEREAFINDIKKLGKTKNGYLYDGSDQGFWIRQEGNYISFVGEH